MLVSATRWSGAMLAALMGCTPAHDWREVRPEGAAVAMFPCRPQHHMRTVGLPEFVAPMHLLVCSAGGQTFAMGYLDVASAANVPAALVALRAAAGTNMGAIASASAPLRVPGMTPSADAVLVSFRGRSPEGAPIESQVGFFTKGLRIYQATIFGAPISSDVAETFFSGLRLP